VECYDAFTEYSAIEAGATNSLAQQLRGRFDMWNNYSGARAMEGVRLDDRLSSLPEVVDVFIGLLRVIIRGLEDGESAVPKSATLTLTCHHGSNCGKQVSVQPQCPIPRQHCSRSRSLSVPKRHLQLHRPEALGRNTGSNK
jgi:hypothetical protein